MKPIINKKSSTATSRKSSLKLRPACIGRGWTPLIESKGSSTSTKP